MESDELLLATQGNPFAKLPFPFRDNGNTGPGKEEYRSSGRPARLYSYSVVKAFLTTVESHARKASHNPSQTRSPMVRSPHMKPTESAGMQKLFWLRRHRPDGQTVCGEFLLPDVPCQERCCRRDVRAVHPTLIFVARAKGVLKAAAQK